MAKVYVVNDSSHDFHKADKFGNIIMVTEGKVPIFKTDVMKHVLDKALKDFNEEDFLLLSGPALLCLMAYQAAVDAMKRYEVLKSRQIKIAIFDAKEQDYTIRHLSV